MMRLQLYGFDLEVQRGYAPHPELEGSVTAAIRIKVSGADRKGTAQFEANDLRRFAGLLERMHKSVGEQIDAVLWSADEQFILSLASGDRGQVNGRYLFGDLSGGFTCDQSYLPTLHRQVLELSALQQAVPADGPASRARG